MTMIEDNDNNILFKQKHTNKLEATIKNLETDKEFVEQALVNTRESRQALVELTESKNNEIEAFRTIKQVMESRVVEMQEKLEIITTQVRLSIIHVDTV